MRDLTSCWRISRPGPWTGPASAGRRAGVPIALLVGGRGMRYVADIGKSDSGTRLYLCPSRKVAVLQVVEPDVYLGDPFGDRTPPPATGGHHRIGCRTNRALDRSISASRRKPDHSLLLERAQKCPSVERSITRSREILDRTRVGLPRDKVRTRLSAGGGSQVRTCLGGRARHRP